MFVYVFLCCFFDQLQSLESNLAMPTRLRVKDCLYDGKSGQYSFPLTIGGISEVVSCLKSCSCNGTAIGWQSKFNCEWCCCEMRVSHEEIVPDYTGYLIWGSIATIFMALLPLICYYQSWKKIKKLKRELAEANSELQTHRIRQDNYGMQNGL